MASNQRSRGLDKSARAAVSGLEWALATLAEKDQPIGPDEFTIREIMSATGKTHDSVRSQLNRAKDRGELVTRTGIVGGHNVTIYKRAG